MSKNYKFEFLGTREMFLNVLNEFPNNDKRFFCFDDYIIEISDNEIRFGVARGGHSGGYWFIPTITEIDDKTTFYGKIHYIDSYTNEKGIKKIINKFAEFFAFILLLPIILIIRIYFLFVWIIRKVFKFSKPKEETPEDRLYALMENYLNCIPK